MALFKQSRAHDTKRMEVHFGCVQLKSKMIVLSLLTGDRCVRAQHVINCEREFIRTKEKNICAQRPCLENPTILTLGYVTIHVPDVGL